MKILLSILSLTLTLSVNTAVSITLTEPAGGPRFVMESVFGDFVVPDGSLVGIGTFEVVPNPAASFEQLALTFQEFGTTQIGHAGAPGPCSIASRRST